MGIITHILLGGVFLNVPNMLTLFRLFLIPVFILFFFSGISNSFLYSIIIFLLAGFTDILDGYIARKYNLVTKWGIILDPFADKLMLITVLSCLVVNSYVPIWVLIVVALKEIVMISSGTYLFTKGTIIPSNVIGKIATLLFYVSIIVLSFNVTIGNYLLYAAVLGSIIALLNYAIIYLESKHKKEI